MTFNIVSYGLLYCAILGAYLSVVFYYL